MAYTRALFPFDTKIQKLAAQGWYTSSAPHRDAGPANSLLPILKTGLLLSGSKMVASHSRQTEEEK